MGHPSSTGGPRVLRFPLYDDTSRTSLTRSVSPRLEAVVNDLIFWLKRVACPGESYSLPPCPMTWCWLRYPLSFSPMT